MSTHSAWVENLLWTHGAWRSGEQSVLGALLFRLDAQNVFHTAWQSVMIVNFLSPIQKHLSLSYTSFPLLELKTPSPVCKIFRSREFFFRFSGGSLLAQFCSVLRAWRTNFMLLGSLQLGHLVTSPAPFVFADNDIIQDFFVFFNQWVILWCYSLRLRKCYKS